MAYKTMLRQIISKWGIMSIELQTAIDKDMAAIHEDGSVDYVDNTPDAEPVVVVENTSAPIDVDPATGEVVGTFAEPEDDPTAAFFNEA